MRSGEKLKVNTVIERVNREDMKEKQPKALSFNMSPVACSQDNRVISHSMPTSTDSTRADIQNGECGGKHACHAFLSSR